ncbi:MAG: cysteine peptidase family C39 domain-containing protein [Zavarzinella sp.]
MTKPIHLKFKVTPQPTETTCGPAVLHSIYRYWDLEISLPRVLREVEQMDGGGTYSVYLAHDAIKRGLRARIYTCDLQLFDPSWFASRTIDLRTKLWQQIKAGHLTKRLNVHARAYLDFLDAGGEILMREPATLLISRFLRQRIPVIAGLCSTWLYRSTRERWHNEQSIPDDITGTPTGHFVVVHGIDPTRRRFDIADPLLQKPFPGRHNYDVPIRRFFNALMLGIMTNDAKLLVIEPRSEDGDA